MNAALRQPAALVLAFSLLAWLWRGIEFATIGSIGPLTLAAGAIALLWIGWVKGGRWWSRSVRLWGVVLLLIGFARAALAVGLVLKPTMSMHGFEALTVPFFAMTLFHLVAGAWLIRRPPLLPEKA